MERKSHYSDRMNITIYSKPFHNDGFEKFLESVYERELKFLASELSWFGLSYSDDLTKAIERAIKICHAAHVSIKQNFKPVYICDNGQLICDWRLSTLGKKLVLLNANPANPIVANLQIQLLNNNKTTR